MNLAVQRLSSILRTLARLAFYLALILAPLAKHWPVIEHRVGG
jgi:hypothetical protein